MKEIPYRRRPDLSVGSSVVTELWKASLRRVRRPNLKTSKNSVNPVYRWLVQGGGGVIGIASTSSPGRERDTLMRNTIVRVVWKSRPILQTDNNLGVTNQGTYRACIKGMMNQDRRSGYD